MEKIHPWANQSFILLLKKLFLKDIVQAYNIQVWAAQLNGLFVNPSLTEPFGLTLLESAACGLPTIATNDGGPSEILSKCGNGVLIDPTDLDNLQTTLEQAFSNQKLWIRWSKIGIEGVSKYFSWNSHVEKYL